MGPEEDEDQLLDVDDDIQLISSSSIDYSLAQRADDEAISLTVSQSDLSSIEADIASINLLSDSLSTISTFEAIQPSLISSSSERDTSNLRIESLSCLRDFKDESRAAETGAIVGGEVLSPIARYFIHRKEPCPRINPCIMIR